MFFQAWFSWGLQGQRTTPVAIAYTSMLKQQNWLRTFTDMQDKPKNFTFLKEIHFLVPISCNHWYFLQHIFHLNNWQKQMKRQWKLNCQCFANKKNIYSKKGFKTLLLYFQMELGNFQLWYACLLGAENVKRAQSSRDLPLGGRNKESYSEMDG